MKSKLVTILLGIIIVLQCAIGTLVKSNSKVLRGTLARQGLLQVLMYDAQEERHVEVMQQFDRLLCDKTRDDLAHEDQ